MQCIEENINHLLNVDDRVNETPEGISKAGKGHTSSCLKRILLEKLKIVEIALRLRFRTGLRIPLQNSKDLKGEMCIC